MAGILIDIEKYVRQLLPPNRRLPKHIALTTTLFKPIENAIQAFNDLVYESQFDTGTPGQVAVLQYILQSYVNANIKVLNADGGKFDFRVLVPEGLGGSERAEVVRIVERYRLRSKRYEVTDLLDWGSGGGDPVTGLAWLTQPIITETNGSWLIQFQVNKADIFPLKIVNTTTGNVRMDITNYEASLALVGFTLYEPGVYRVELGSLRGNATAIGTTETNIKPDWLSKVVFNYDPNGHECSKYVNATADVQMQIAEVSGVAVGGVSWENVPWNQNTWIAGTNVYADGYNEVFRANGTSFGQGGILPGATYKIKIRRTAVPGEVFVYTWTAPNTPVNKQEIVFGPVAGTCERGPFIVANSISAEDDRIIFSFDAKNVTAFKWRIKKDNLILRSDIQQMLNPNGSAKFSPSNRPVLNFVKLDPGNYTLEIEGASCSSGVSARAFTVEAGAEVPEFPDDPTPGTPSLTLLGTFEIIEGGRRLTYQGSPGLKLAMVNGRLTDVTPGTVHGTGGNHTTCNGRNVFYMMRYRYFCGNGDGVRVYKTLQNIYLPDCIQTISRFDCDPTAIPDFNAFIDGYGGYPISTGVNKFNAEMSQVTITLHTLDNPGIPLWLTISRALNFVYYVPNRPISKKVFAIESINRGDSAAQYHAKDVRTQTQFDNSVPQPYTCRTWKFGRDWHPGEPLFSDNELYNFLRGPIEAFKLNEYTVITDEVPENAQGGDSNIGKRVGLVYKGAADLFREKDPNFHPRKYSMFGSYGGDRFYRLIDPAFIFKHSKAVVAEFLSTKVHSSWNDTTNTWNPGLAAFYESKQYKDRGINVDYYFYFGAYRFNLPVELVFTNERIKIGTKTTVDGDWECDWITFGTILSQSLMRNELGQQIGPEEFRTGDIIPYSNGEVLSKYNTPIAGNAGEHWDMGFWSCLIGRRGTFLWDGGGSYGKDKTKISTYTPADQFIRWYPQSGGNEPYVSGQNGAPVNDVEGMKDTLYSTVVDATMAGHQAALSCEGYADTLYYGSYTSSRKTFVAEPGQAGLHLNGFGPLNMGILVVKDIVDQNAAMSVVGVGPLGWMAAYNNGHLSPDEYEDDVVVTYANKVFDFGRVYGGQTKYIKQ